MKFEKLFKALFLFGLILLCSAFVYHVFVGNFFLYAYDEVTYYNAARSFYETGSMQSTSCISEFTSAIGTYNWYGPFYHLLYGTIAKIFGFSILIFPFTHLLFVFISIYFLLKFPLQKDVKYILLFCFISSFAITNYLFTLYPEVFHVFSGVLLSLVLYKWQNESKKNHFLFLYIFLIFVFSLFRPTSIFWLFALIPFALSIKDFLLKSGMAFIGLLLSIIYMKYFTAPAFVESMKAMDSLFKLEMVDFVSACFFTFKTNLIYIKNEAHTQLIFFFLLLTISTVRGVWHRDRFMLAAVLSTSILLGVMLCLYTSIAYFLLKQMNLFFPFLLITNLMLKPEGKFKYYYLMLQLCFLPSALSLAQIVINERKAAYKIFTRFADEYSSFEEIKKYVRQDRNTVVLWSVKEFKAGGRTLAFLPLSNANGNPILYTSNIAYGVTTPAMRYEVFDRLKIDYVLSTIALENETNLSFKVRKLFETPLYSFYEVIP